MNTIDLKIVASMKMDGFIKMMTSPNDCGLGYINGNGNGHGKNFVSVDENKNE